MSRKLSLRAVRSSSSWQSTLAVRGAVPCARLAFRLPALVGQGMMGSKSARPTAVLSVTPTRPGH